MDIDLFADLPTAAAVRDLRRVGCHVQCRCRVLMENVYSGEDPMNLALWVGQALLAMVFVYSGALKVSQSREKLLAMGQTGAAVFPLPVLRFVAACELLGAAGVIVPWLTNIAPVLTPLAAAGFVVIMVGAIAAHARLREPRNVAATSFILLVAAFVVAGRVAGL